MKAIFFEKPFTKAIILTVIRSPEKGFFSSTKHADASKKDKFPESFSQIFETTTVADEWRKTFAALLSQETCWLNL